MWNKDSTVAVAKEKPVELTVDATLAEARQAFLGYMTTYHEASPHTLRSYRADLQTFTRWMEENGPDTRIDSVTRELVTRYAVTLQHLAPATIQRKVHALSSLYRFLQDLGLVRGNPTHGVRLPRIPETVRNVLDEEQAARVLSRAETPWERCALALLLGTGIRRGELVAIRVEDLDLERSELLVRGKGGRHRTVPLAPGVLKEVETYLECRYPQRQATDLLLQNRLNRRLNGRLVAEMLRRIVYRAGITRKITPHCLRHTFATQLIRNGVDVETVRELLGHASLSTTQQYVHSDAARKAQAVAGLNLGLNARGETQAVTASSPEKDR